MTDFLLELRSEEIPARMQARARDDLARLFAAEIAKDGLVAMEIVTYATPRRLALIARGLPDETEPVRHETKGPKVGAPDQAIDGFLRRYQLAREDLKEREGVYFLLRNAAGRPTFRVLSDAIEAVILGFPWPKSMRWGADSASTESLRWVRPLHGIVALFGTDIVYCEVAGMESGATTLGHRFHHPGPITIGSANDYAAKLRACHVIVDPAEREALIRERARALAAEAGLELIADEGLVAENGGLTEWPVPLLGRFDAGFLAVPPEVIQLTARVNQKYFVCRSPDGALANAFICTANIDAVDGGTAIVEGNRKVLAARLADARFFYETDLKVSLDEQAKKLDRIVFHEKLGTVADKVERVAKLAEWLASEGIVPGCDPALARRAAELCKADLVTGMVGEFPELQGIMGGYYAAAQGEDEAVADAIRDHYKPVGQGDDVPIAPLTVAVSLADKLDTLIGFFGVQELPSGSRDPFALRRAALAVIRLLEQNQIRLSLRNAHVFDLRDFVTRRVYAAVYKDAATDAMAAIRIGANPFAVNDPDYRKALLNQPDIKDYVEGFAKSGDPFLDFFADRLKVQQREAGVRHDLIEAVFALGGEDDLVRLLARVRALQAFVGTTEGANLLAGYKRAANILKKEGYPVLDRHPGLVPGSTDPRAQASDEGWTPAQGRGDGEDEATTASVPAQTALVSALDAAEPAAAAAVAREDFAAAMVALATLRAPIDWFFEEVIVNDPDPATRAIRLALLARVRAAVHTVADFSRIEA